MRTDGREKDQLRDINIYPNYLKNAHGSVLMEVGDTRVICTANMEDRVPPFLTNTGKGWVTAEYSMLPSATHSRSARESTRGKVGGRTHEIQRLIGRSLRSVIDTQKLGERTILVDCDVIQADGGTRTTSVTGAFLALAFAVEKLKRPGGISGAEAVLKDYLAATSVGLINGVPHLDLNYEEDSMADVDANIVMTGAGKYVEIQGTAEGEPFAFEEMRGLLDLAQKGISELIKIQKQFVNGILCV